MLNDVQNAAASGMQAYESEADAIVSRFLDLKLSYPECIAALDAALAGLILTLTGEELPRLRIVVLSNNEIVVKEMERRRLIASARATEQF
jgi:hypothetical protein